MGHAAIAPRVEQMGVERRVASDGTAIPAGVTAMTGGVAAELASTVLVAPLPEPARRGIPARADRLGNLIPGVPATLPAERAEPVS